MLRKSYKNWEKIFRKKMKMFVKNFDQVILWKQIRKNRTNVRKRTGKKFRQFFGN